jgi:hypothetical protein
MNRPSRTLVFSLLVIVALIGLSIVLGLAIENNRLGTVADWVEALSTFATLIVTGFAAYLAYQKFLKDETFTASENQVIVFSTNQQTTELVATPEGLELYLYDTRPNRRKGRQWIIPVDKLTPPPVISVYSSRKKNEWGMFDIGDHSQWYYSKKLFPTEKDLHDTIKSLIDKSKQLAQTQRRG